MKYRWVEDGKVISEGEINPEPTDWKKFAEEMRDAYRQETDAVVKLMRQLADKDELVERAAKLLRGHTVYCYQMLSYFHKATSLIPDVDWAEQRDQWLKDAGVESKP
jgi:hypothetical protein